MSQTACVALILSLFLLLSMHKYTHTHTHTHTLTHDSCVWLGKCLWLNPTPHPTPNSSHPLAPFLETPTPQLPPVTSCAPAHISPQLLKMRLCSAGESNPPPPLQLSLGPLSWPIWIGKEWLFAVPCPLESRGPEVRARICFLPVTLPAVIVHCIKASRT